MNNNTIKYSIDADGIATLIIDMPNRSMNVLSAELVSDLSNCVDQITTDENVIGVILTSGKSAFVAGADLTEIVTMFDRGLSAEQGYIWSQKLSKILRKLETCGKPVAVAINGLALGGGFELCLACHYRLLANHSKAFLGLPEVAIGLMPGWGGTQRLPRLVGVEKSLAIILQGQRLSPQKALDLGVVDEVAPVDELLDRARTWLMTSPDPIARWDTEGFQLPGWATEEIPASAQITKLGTSMLPPDPLRNYPAPISAISAIYQGCLVSIDTGLDIESKYFGKLLSGVTARNMVRSLFVNKAAADKLVRRPDGIEKRRVTKLGILDAGMMGAGIAYVSAGAGIQVVLLDTDIENAQHGKTWSEDLLKKAIARGYSSEEKAGALLGLIQPSSDYTDLEACDLVIEAVFENRGVKATVTAKAEAVIPESAIFASNTSTLQITGLAEASIRPENFIGLHFFSPVDKMPLVELIVGEKSSDQAIALGLDYIQQIRKTPIVVNDSPGFYTSRVFSTSTNEAMTMLAEGINPALIENAAKMAGMPVGPLAVMDELTLELGYKITLQAASDQGDDYSYASGFPVLRKFVEDLDRKGKRYGKGFYDYPKGEKKRLWPGLAEIYPPIEQQPDVQETIDRLLYRQALETARCFEEGVLDDVADADIGAIFGWGYPAWTGGTLSFIDTVGIRHFVTECDRMTEIYGPRFAVSDWLRDKAEKGVTFHKS